MSCVALFTYRHRFTLIHLSFISMLFMCLQFIVHITAISLSRRRSASAALHSNSSSVNNTASKDTNQSSHNHSSQTCPSIHSTRRSSTVNIGPAVTNRSSTTRSSTITTRRKSLSIGIHQQRKRSIN